MGHNATNLYTPIPPQVETPEWFMQALFPQVHHSHHVVSYRGVVWCWKCGSWRTTVSRNLAKQCTGHATVACQRVLDRVRANKPPISSMEWPLPDPGLQGLQPAIGGREF